MSITLFLVSLRRPRYKVLKVLGSLSVSSQEFSRSPIYVINGSSIILGFTFLSGSSPLNLGWPMTCCNQPNMAEMMLRWFQRLWLKETWLLLLFNSCGPWATMWGQQSFWKGHLASKGPWDNKTIWYKRKKKKRREARKTERPVPRGTASWMWPVELPPAKPAEMFKWDQPGNLRKQNHDRKKKGCLKSLGFRVVCYIAINNQNNAYLVPSVFA